MSNKGFSTAEMIAGVIAEREDKSYRHLKILRIRSAPNGIILYVADDSPTPLPITPQPPQDFSNSAIQSRLKHALLLPTMPSAEVEDHLYDAFIQLRDDMLPHARLQNDALPEAESQPTFQASSFDKNIQRVIQLRKAVEWVLNDAAYKAPEQIGETAARWINVLQRALNDDPETEQTLPSGAGDQNA